MPKPRDWIRHMSRDTVVESITFIAVLTLITLLLGSANRRFAERQLHSHAEGLALAFQNNIERAREELQRLPAPAQLDCPQGLSPLLAQHTFDNGSLRWIAIERDGVLLCRSHVVGIQWTGPDVPPRQLHRLDDTMALVALQGGEHRFGLFLQLTRDGVHYLAALEPPRLGYVGDVDCAGCRAFSLRIDGDPPLLLDSEPLSHAATLEQRITRARGALLLELILQADDNFVDHYRLQGWVATLLVGLCLASVMTYAIHRVLKVRHSMDFLIREGLRRRAFLPYYQPIVDSRDGSILGAEALVRWVGRDGQVVPPAQFVPYAEETGLIQPITDQLTETIVQDIAHFGWTGTKLYVSINLVPEQLGDTRYGKRLGELIAQHGLAGHNVSVEVTERRQFHDLVRARQVLNVLVQQNIEIKLDDAGTGFGGFSYVQELPIGTLKIDKMFVDTLRPGVDAKRPVLDAIVEFAKSSGLAMIAEGVETPEQVSALAAMGVYAIQGYVYGKPMSAREFMQWAAVR